MDSLINLDPEISIKISSDGSKELVKDLGFSRIRIEFVPFGVTGNVWKAYEALAHLYARYSYRILIDMVYGHSSEYLLLLLENGKAVVLQGYETKVVYPSKQEILFSSHTHPRAPAILSKKDIFSALDLLSKRGFVFCVVGLDGEFCIYRKLLLQEEDYENMIYVANDIGFLDIGTLIKIAPQSIGFIKI